MSKETYQGDTLILRPMLDVTRDEITKYVNDHGSDWIEDPTNASLTNDRNFLRNVIIPEMFNRFIRARSAFMTTIEQMRDAADLIDDLAKLDMERCFVSDDTISFDAFREIGKRRARNMMSYYLCQQHIQNDGSKMVSFVEQIYRASYNSKTEVIFSTIVLKQHGKKIIVLMKE